MLLTEQADYWCLEWLAAKPDRLPSLRAKTNRDLLEEQVWKAKGPGDLSARSGITVPQNVPQTDHQWGCTRCLWRRQDDIPRSLWRWHWIMPHSAELGSHFSCDFSGSIEG